MREGARTKQARSLRKAPTSAEAKLWSRIRRGQIEGFRFRRQHPIGRFIADFACIEARLVIEVDGATHSTDAERANDARRTDWLESEGWRVFRAWNHEIYDNLDGVLEAIRLAVLDGQD